MLAAGGPPGVHPGVQPPPAALLFQALGGKHSSVRSVGLLPTGSVRAAPWEPGLLAARAPGAGVRLSRHGAHGGSKAPPVAPSPQAWWACPSQAQKQGQDGPSPSSSLSSCLRPCPLPTSLPGRGGTVGITQTACQSRDAVTRRAHGHCSCAGPCSQNRAAAVEPGGGAPEHWGSLGRKPPSKPTRLAHLPALSGAAWPFPPPLSQRAPRGQRTADSCPAPWRASCLQLDLDGLGLQCRLCPPPARGPRAGGSTCVRPKCPRPAGLGRSRQQL